MSVPSMTPALIETADTGGRTLPISMVVCPPERAVTSEQLTDQMAAADGLNVPFIAGTLSAFLAHERAGAALYRVAAEHSENPGLIDKYNEFGRQTVEHVTIYQQLIADLGGDPHYVSPAARMTEQLGAKLLEGPVSLAGSVDLVTLETAFLEAVAIAEQKCHNNWMLLSQLGAAFGDETARNTVRDAIATVQPQEDDHVRWATDTYVDMALTNARHPNTAAQTQSAARPQRAVQTNAVAKKAAPQQAGRTGTTSKKAASKKATSAKKASASKQAASKSTSAKKASAPKKAVSKKATSAKKASASKKAASKKSTGGKKGAVERRQRVL